MNIIPFEMIKKHITIILFFICSIVTMQLQAQTILLEGAFTKKGNYEITVAGKEAARSFRVAKYVLDTTSNQFALTIPYKSNISYNLQIVRLKEGHRRLEVDTAIQVPLTLKENTNLLISINADKFKTKNKGVSIKKNTKKGQLTVVKGWVLNAMHGMDLSFDKVEDGQTKSVASVFVQKGDSTFCFAMPNIKEGMYYLSTLSAKKAVYLKPGEEIDLALNLLSGTEVTAVKTTEENAKIADWEKIKLPFIMMDRLAAKTDFATFSNSYTEVQPQVVSFLDNIKTTNPAFNSLFKTAVKLDNNLFALSILLKNSKINKGAYFIASKDFLNTPTFFKEYLNQNKIESNDLLSLGDGYRYLNTMARFSLVDLDDVSRKSMSDAERVQYFMSSLQNETLKPYLLKAQLDELEEYLSNYSEFKETFIPYEKYASHRPFIQKKYNGLLNMFVADTVFIGKPANDFVIPDANGKMTSMDQFKGKVVLIDVWATWCGPCKAQIPFLQEIEEEYKDNSDVVFIGISLDAERDKQKWIDFMKEKNLHGVQLIDDRGKAFGKKYGLLAIPRFMLIDKNGNWAEVRCPLPENKEKLRRYINRELSK